MSQVVVSKERNIQEILIDLAINGDLSKLNEPEKLLYYKYNCDYYNLDIVSRPFDYVWLGKGEARKLVLYPNKTAVAQLRKNHGIHITELKESIQVGLIIIKAYGHTKDGRSDVDEGFAPLSAFGKQLEGEALGNARLKAVTKAKRRLTLSLGGMGMLDETEIDSIPDAIKVHAGNLQDVTNNTQPKIVTEKFSLNLEEGELSDVMDFDELFKYLEDALKKIKTTKQLEAHKQFISRNKTIMSKFKNLFPAKTEILVGLSNEAEERAEIQELEKDYGVTIDR